MRQAPAGLYRSQFSVHSSRFPVQRPGLACQGRILSQQNHRELQTPISELPSRTHRAIFCAAEAINLGRNLERRILRRKFLRWRFGFGSGCGHRLGAKGSEIFECENLLTEDLAELAGRTMRDGFKTGQCFRIRNFPFEAV